MSCCMYSWYCIFVGYHIIQIRQENQYMIPKSFAWFLMIKFCILCSFMNISMVDVDKESLQDTSK